MKCTKRQELIKAYIDFFKSKEHREIPPSSLIPENDPTVLFTTAGMHPLVPYILGQKHPLGKRLVDIQKCIRTDDIDEVGDEVHHTFFEMLGNWSLGDYWKEEVIKWSFEFLTKILKIPVEKLAVSVFAGDKDAPADEESALIWKKLGISEKRIAYLPKRNNWWPAPKQETIGPCGSDTEMFYWADENKAPEKFDPNNDNWVEIWNDVFIQYEKKKRVVLADGMYCLYDKNFKINSELMEFLQSLNTKIILVVNGYKEKAEILVKNYGYDIFSFNGEIKKDNEEFFVRLLKQYKLTGREILYFDHDNINIKTATKSGIKNVQLFEGYAEKIKEFIQNNLFYFAQLKQKNVDTGMGVERTLAVLNELKDNYQTSIFKPIIEEIEKISGRRYDESKETRRAMRIIADHLRAAVFILGDERAIKPSNLGQGYVLRRLIRRAVRYGKILKIKDNFTLKIAKAILPIYPDYQELARNHKTIYQELEEEEEKFKKTLEKGLKKFNDISHDKIITGEEAFLLFQSYGFPIEMTQELASEKGTKVDLERYNEESNRHQDLSRGASAGQFKSGLADDSEATKKLHTATHLLNEALRKVLGKEVKQKGSNITPERLRFDFNFSRKLTELEIKEVEDLVNKKIQERLDVEREELPLSDALGGGAQGEFGMKYPDLVSVYTIVDSKEKKGWWSKEICTGPHVKNTREIGKFKIVREESVAAGIRRIKAVIE